MARDGDLPTIFNPKRVRTPSVIITSEVETEQVEPERERANGPQTPLSPRAPLTPQASVCSAPPLTTQPSLQHAYSESAASSQDEERQLRDKKCPRSCCSKFAKKVPLSQVIHNQPSPSVRMTYAPECRHIVFKSITL